MAAARKGEPRIRRENSQRENPPRRRRPSEDAPGKSGTDTRDERRAQRGEPSQDSNTGRGSTRTRRSLRAAEVAQMALKQVYELTGCEPEGVTSVQPSEEGWAVGVEVVESRRIPDTSDILAVYETELDAGGELVSYRRTDRYARGRGNER